MKYFYMQWLCIFIFSYVNAHERPIVVVIPSYNNQEWCHQNLDSVFMQQYSNYRIISIDDCSTDNNYSIVCAHVKECRQEHRTTIVHNSNRLGALANHYKSVWMCDNHEIIVQLDGDDCFAHAYVLARINSAYDDPMVWLTYGQYISDPPEKSKGQSRLMPDFIIRKNGYREYPWITSAPRTFYAWLFKEIRLESLLYHGRFFKTTCDLAFMFPMLEMAAGHICFIPDILYIYNCKTSNNDYKIHLQAQLRAEFIIRAQKKYTAYTKAPVKNTEENYNCSCLIISHDNPHELSLLLTSLEQHVIGLTSCTVLSSYSSEKMLLAYQELAHHYTNITFIHATSTDYKECCMQALKTSTTPYLLLAHASYRITHPVDLHSCAHMLAKTKAYGFYLTLGTDITKNPLLECEQKIPTHTPIKDTINAWQFHTGHYAWREPNTFSMALYRTTDVVRACTQGRFSTPHTLAEVWRQYPVDLHSVGLFFDHSVAQDNT